MTTERGGSWGVLAGGSHPAAFRSLEHGQVPDNMQGRRWMELGHGKGSLGCVGPKNTGDKEGPEGACG